MNRIHAKTPLGRVEIESDGKSVTRLSFEVRGKPTRADSVLRRARKELKEYFSGKRRRFTVPVSQQGTAFQSGVWRQLTRIPYGKTSGYGEVAKKMRRAGAARAVGGACNANNVSIIVPCHRVVGADGALTGFGAGIQRKRKLLTLESEKV
jgi:methylated-DNA-[protein]-cysteine S-methyltransferase